MVEPQYDSEDAGNYYPMQEKLALRKRLVDIQQHMLLTLSDMGVEDGKTLQDIQRRLHVDTPTAMRLLALHNAVKGLLVW